MNFCWCFNFILFLIVPIQSSFFNRDNFTKYALYRDYLYGFTSSIKYININTVIQVYVSETSSKITNTIIERLFEVDIPRSMVIDTMQGSFLKKSITRTYCIAITNNHEELEIVLQLLYHKAQHDLCVICVNYPISEPKRYLSIMTGNIWTKGLSRNVYFLVMSEERNLPLTFRAPSFMPENCHFGELIESGFFENKTFIPVVKDFWAPSNDFSGCPLNIMVQIPQPPYVRRQSKDPGGIVGMFISDISKQLNFTPNYIWSYSREVQLSHTKSSNLNILFDLLPRAMTPVNKFSFNLGIVTLSFMVERVKGPSEWTNLVSPFQGSVWACIVASLMALLILSYFKSSVDPIGVLLKAFGILLGISIGNIPKSPWIKCFFWIWLLPAFILQQLYIASLVKNMSVLNPFQDINTVGDLIKSDKNVICSSGTKMFLCLPSNIHHYETAQLCRRCNLVRDEYIYKYMYTAAVKGRSLNNTSFVANHEIIKSSIGYRNVKFITGFTLSVPQTVSVRPGNLYIHDIRRIYSRFLESGLFEYWKFKMQAIANSPKIARSTDIVNDKLQRCFFIILFGWLIGLSAFIGEIVVHKYYKRRK